MDEDGSMTPRMIKKERKAGDITLAALALFSQRGYAATSVDQIAKAAGIGKSTVYEYYATKEDIFIAAINAAMARWESRLMDMLRDKEDPIEGLNGVVDLNLEMFDPDNPGEARLFLEVLQHTFTEGGVFYNRRHLITAIHSRIRRIIVDFLLSGVSRGVLRPEIARDAEKIAINFLAYIDGIGLHSMIAKDYIDMKEQIDFFLDNLIGPLTSAGTGTDKSIIDTARE
jgi:AcrR family transcriptional regulator